MTRPDPPSLRRKRCGVCKLIFVRRDNEGASAFRDRVTCSHVCALTQRRQPKYDSKAFITCWESSANVAECASRLGITIQLARNRRNALRASGIAVRKFKEASITVSVFGVSLAVAEISYITGLSRESILRRIHCGLSPLMHRQPSGPRKTREQ